MAYKTAVPMALPLLVYGAAAATPATAAMGTLITPLVGVIAAAIALGEPLELLEMLTLAVPLGSVSLAIRQRG